jgi:hypothetical protein
MDAKPKERTQNRLHTWEYFALAGGFICLWLFLNKYALGGPNSSDVTWYYHVGASNLKEPFILNRYFHIFLQKFFVGTQPDPIQGLQFILEFFSSHPPAISSTWRKAAFSPPPAAPGTAYWRGAFFSLPAIREVSGIPYVDVTAMMMLSALLLVYVLSANVDHQKRSLLILFGCLLFLGFKTKETVLPGAIMLLGFGIKDSRIAWRLWGKRVLWILVGLLTGLVLFTLLNALVLHDVLFGCVQRICEFIWVHISKAPV